VKPMKHIPPSTDIHQRKAVGRDKDDAKYTTYSTPYEKKDPSAFPPPPRTKTYGPREGSVAPPRPTLPSSAFAAENEAEELEPTYVRGPFRSDTSGIVSSQYPKPPPRTGKGSSTIETSKPPPALPPRLPPREIQSDRQQNSYINQGAIARLGKAGISVPGFNIGGSDENPAPSPGLPVRGTSWADKKAALTTANKLKTDPSSVSLQDAQNAATTAKNFHERHGSQLASGLQTAGKLNQRYGLADRVSGTLEPAGPTPSPKKAPPPPPPPKKTHLQGMGTLPPPIPFQSKPQS
jgi:hypothetical protein